MKDKEIVFWKKNVFTDESKIKTSGSDGRVFVRRKSTEKWLPCCTLGTVTTGETSIMVRVCMCYDGVGPIVTIQGTFTGRKYRQILQNNYLPLVAERQRRCLDKIIPDDNAPVHRANVVTSWKTKRNVKCLEWPAQNPDLNPIENLWMAFKKSFSTDSCRPTGCCEGRMGQNSKRNCPDISCIHD